MLDLLASLCHVGHVASARQLRGWGATKRQLVSALESGLVQRVRRGVYACTHLDGAALRAVRAGADLDCLTVLARHEVWSGIDEPALHLRMDQGRHQRRHIPGAVVHWSTTLGKSAIPWEVSPLDALLQAIKCLPPDDALASVESALHTGFITEDEFDELVLRAPERLHGVLGEVDRGAQSGFETHTRLRILRAGFRVKTQFYVPRAGHFDLLVNDCVAVETDGAKWHGPERFLPDRTKDLIAEGQGVRVLRIGRPHIFEWWPQTLHTIQQMVSDAEHGSQQR